MATVAFQPTASVPFQFGATFDGQDYTCTVLWNFYRVGWYLQIVDTSNTVVVYRALVSAPPSPPPALNLLFGYFLTSTMYFDDASQSFVVTP
jgi:hypothetical protein